MDKYLETNIIFSKFSRDYMDLKKDLPIRPSEMGVLNIITQRDGLFTPVMIAELLDVSKPMITSHIIVLEKKGYITKEPSKDDKRSFYILPTDKARELVNTTNEKMNKQLSMLEFYLGEKDFRNLTKLLDKTIKFFKEKI